MQTILCFFFDATAWRCFVPGITIYEKSQLRRKNVYNTYKNKLKKHKINDKYRMSSETFQQSAAQPVKIQTVPSSKSQGCKCPC